MANEEHLNILKQGIAAWNEWRQEESLRTTPDLSGADLSGIDFSHNLPATAEYSLKGINLCMARMDSVNLARANLHDAYLIAADLRKANLIEANLVNASLREANLSDANLRNADLTGADVTEVTYSSGTIWPKGFNPVARGAKQIRKFYGARESIATAKDEIPGFFGKTHSEDADLTVMFAPELSQEQIKTSLQVLAAYYRACGGVGFKVTWELEDVLVGEIAHV